MMGIGQDQRGAARYEVDAHVAGTIGDESFEAQLKDVSSTGAAVVGMGDRAWSNDTFVQMHMDGLGARKGYVRRSIPDGFAIEFENANDEEEKRRLEARAQFKAMGSQPIFG